MCIYTHIYTIDMHVSRYIQYIHTIYRCMLSTHKCRCVYLYRHVHICTHTYMSMRAYVPRQVLSQAGAGPAAPRRAAQPRPAGREAQGRSRARAGQDIGINSAERAPRAAQSHVVRP